MQKQTVYTIIVALVLAFASLAWYAVSVPTPMPQNAEMGGATTTTTPTTHKDIIRVSTPLPNSLIWSPLAVHGEARGSWYFEATFPVVLTDWDGRIIAEGYATALLDPNDPDSTWMTTDYVPFEATFNFVSPYRTDDPDFMRRGSLILQKSNPSGLPEHDDALEYMIKFAP